ncbi:uncharacterized protein LOC107304437 [Oryza brachyantha]|uniref:uncharacterized protein LOC107304437 n=1 Tax=Oryza brachyantha TaxID=4533 RepID=UPI00077660F0|nr:uncharacterized protein LOC107304437 [Oryza brachyantha]
MRAEESAPQPPPAGSRGRRRRPHHAHAHAHAHALLLLLALVALCVAHATLLFSNAATNLALASYVHESTDLLVRYRSIVRDVDVQENNSIPGESMNISPKDTEPSVKSTTQMIADTEPSVKSTAQMIADTEPSVKSTTQMIADTEPSVKSTAQMIADTEPSVKSTTQMIADTEPSVKSTAQMIADTEPSVKSTTQMIADTEPSVKSTAQMIADTEPSVKSTAHMVADTEPSTAQLMVAADEASKVTPLTSGVDHHVDIIDEEQQQQEEGHPEQHEEEDHFEEEEDDDCYEEEKEEAPKWRRSFVFPMDHVLYLGWSDNELTGRILSPEQAAEHEERLAQDDGGGGGVIRPEASGLTLSTYNRMPFFHAIYWSLPGHQDDLVPVKLRSISPEEMRTAAVVEDGESKEFKLPIDGVILYRPSPRHRRSSLHIVARDALEFAPISSPEKAVEGVLRRLNPLDPTFIHVIET